MVLKVTGRHERTDFALHRLADDGRLVLARGHQDDPFRVEDGSDAHGHRLDGHVVLAEEIGSGVLAGTLVQADQPGARVRQGTGLVEPDVAGAPDAQELDADTAHGTDTFLVPGAVVLDFLRREVAQRDVDLVFGYVYMVEEIFLHVTVVTLGRLPRHGVVFVEVEGNDILETDAAAVQCDQFPVHVDGRGSRAKAQHGHLPRLGARLGVPDDLPGDGPRKRFVVGTDGDVYMFGGRMHASVPIQWFDGQVEKSRRFPGSPYARKRYLARGVAFNALRVSLPRPRISRYGRNPHNRKTALRRGCLCFRQVPLPVPLPDTMT